MRPIKMSKNTQVKIGRPPQWPFAKLKVNEYFEFSIDEYYRVKTAASYWGKRNNRKFHVSKTLLRCTRVSKPRNEKTNK